MAHAPDNRNRRGQLQELADFFDNAPVALLCVGPDGPILRANWALLRLLGHTVAPGDPEELGQHFAGLHADREAGEDMLRRLRSGEELHDHEAHLRCRDGSIKHVLIDANVKRQDGQFLLARCFIRDAGERKRAEEARWLLAAIVESAEGAIISKTLDGVITSWNAGAERLFEYTAAEAIGRSITLIILPERHSEEDMILSRLRRGERIEHYETVRQSRQGRQIDISLTISPVRDGTGRIIGASKVARDITAQKEAARALQEANRRKDEFLAMLAHELRNPLAPIRNAVHIFRAKAPPVPELQWAREVFDRQVHLMTRLVDDLLDVSRIGRGKIVLRKERTELAAVVSNAVEGSRPAEAERLRGGRPGASGARGGSGVDRPDGVGAGRGPPPSSGSGLRSPPDQAGRARRVAAVARPNQGPPLIAVFGERARLGCGGKFATCRLSVAASCKLGDAGPRENGKLQTCRHSQT
jgi:PAS domain S-box-containing protein